MSTPEMAGQPEPRNYETHPLTADEVEDTFARHWDLLEGIWNDPATHEGAAAALAKAQADLAANGELMEPPY